MVKAVDPETNIYAPLFFGRLRIIAEGSPEQYLSRLSRNFTTFSEDPISSVTGRFNGKVDGSRFRFHRVEWFSGRVNPRCSGTVSQFPSGKMLIAATVQAVSLVLVTVAFVVLPCVLFWNSPTAIVMSLGISAICILRNVFTFRSGFAEVQALLTKTIGEGS
jgi:hypothetical protein